MKADGCRFDIVPDPWQGWVTLAVWRCDTTEQLVGVYGAAQRAITRVKKRWTPAAAVHTQTQNASHLLQ